MWHIFAFVWILLLLGFYENKNKIRTVKKNVVFNLIIKCDLCRALKYSRKYNYYLSDDVFFCRRKLSVIENSAI